jgi:hypothetical protein
MAFTLDPNEYVFHEERRSWFTLWTRTITWLFSILIPIIIFSVIESLDFIKIEGNKDALLIVFLLSWIFFVWNGIFVIWTDYYLDVFVITNKNLINIEQKGFFSREVAVLSLDKIQDMTTELHGLVETAINYGDIRIQSAGKEKEFILHDINRPEFVRSKIKEAISGQMPIEKSKN